MSVIKSLLADGETIDSLMDKYNQDTDAEKNRDGDYVGFYINEYSMTEDFINVAFALEENQISDPFFVEEYGHCLVKRVPFDRDELISIYMSDVEYSYSTEYATLIQETQQTMDIVFSSNYNSISSELIKTGTDTENPSETSETENESVTESTSETTTSVEAE